MSALAQKLRKNRELTVSVGRWKFIARRPTDVEAIDLHRRGAEFSEIARRFVIGWEGVTRDDLGDRGMTDPAPFDREDWEEWVADRSDFWTPIASGVLAAYEKYRTDLEAAPKN